MGTLVRKLRSWQLVETFFSGAFLLSIFAAVAFLGLATACTIDWWVDRHRDTPLWLRACLTGTQLVVYAALAGFLVLKWRKPSLDALALRAEQATPSLGHRLVTALQLNRAGARTAGMSQELIQQVTEEANAMASSTRFMPLADKKPLARASVLFTLVVFTVILLFALNSNLMLALVQRQALLNVEIPRSVQVENASRALFPAGDAVQLEFRVVGPVQPETRGTVRVFPDGQQVETYEAEFAGSNPDGSARFIAKLPPASQPFRFLARVGDGRMRQFAQAKFEPRPAVTKVQATVILPKYVDPKGQIRYERFQPQAEVIAPADAAVRVEITSSKPVRWARLTVLGRDDQGQELVLISQAMALNSDRTEGSLTFDLPASPTGYRIDLEDDFGFANLNSPRRGITILPDETPLVELLDEVDTDNPTDPKSIEAGDVKGIPLRENGHVLVGYRARSSLGLSEDAFIVYRVNEGEWSSFRLKRVEADLTKTGPFVPEVGVFASYTSTQQVEYYWIPSPDRETEPDGLSAGGRYKFLTASLTKIGRDGQPTKLEIGDRVELYVAVYDRKPGQRQIPTDRNSPGRPPGVSESRIKQVVTASQWVAWFQERDQTRKRLKQIEDAQLGVFGQPPKP